ncbi:sulfite exporter TauE/SafE family protein [Mucilaginibacter rubeus]|uniref:Probable membrane transporter protein n=1 Tax=Mucilaginibacter rubeus TaxID=2027860 RepID=A0A5C1I760_9SPHI|nr:sulfite exporter TauE/SafE family protein [Mucilaginibacter rubeus]QEM13616.1 sulfite exporter TauE/SafE family protein [Mucilaginibacter rubeus]
MSLTISLLFIIALLAFILSAVCGGGASMILIPVLGLVVPNAQIPVALSLGTASSSLSRVAVMWKSIRWDLVKWFIPPAIPTVWLGAWLLTYVNPVFLQLLLGLFLLWNLSSLFKKQPVLKVREHQSNVAVLLIGLATGFVSGLTGAVGLIFNRFYLTYGLSKQEIVATRAANEVILHLIKLGLYASFGLLTNNSVIYGVIIAIAAVISSFAVKYVLPLISDRLFQKIGYAAMVISGCFMTYGAVRDIASGNLRISIVTISGGLETSVQWKESDFKLELEYDEGFEVEHAITLNELPPVFRPKVTALIEGADKYLIEEVNGFRKHYYEVYTWRQGKLSKYDVK